MKTMSEPPVRGYRSSIGGTGRPGFSVRLEQTDLFIRADRDLTGQAFDLVRTGRSRILSYAERHEIFLTSLKSLPLDPLAPSPVREMLEAADRARVGPMAAVAGAMAEFVGVGLRPFSPGGVIVENGGDIFIQTSSEITVGLFAGTSPLSLRLGLRIPPSESSLGVCTSSGSVGHSLSYGKADAAVVVADSTALADAAATALGNRVASRADIEPALAWTLSLKGVRGAIVILNDRIGLRGDLNLVELSS